MGDKNYPRPVIKITQYIFRFVEIYGRQTFFSSKMKKPRRKGPILGWFKGRANPRIMNATRSSLPLKESKFLCEALFPNKEWGKGGLVLITFRTKSFWIKALEAYHRVNSDLRSRVFRPTQVCCPSRRKAVSFGASFFFSFFFCTVYPTIFFNEHPRIGFVSKDTLRPKCISIPVDVRTRKPKRSQSLEKRIWQRFKVVHTKESTMIDLQ